MTEDDRIAAAIAPVVRFLTSLGFANAERNTMNLRRYANGRSRVVLLLSAWEHGFDDVPSNWDR